VQSLRSISLYLAALGIIAAACAAPGSGATTPAHDGVAAPLTSLPPATSLPQSTSSSTTTTTIALPQLPDVGAGTVCDLYSPEVHQLGTITSEAVTEASGIASGRANDVYWVVNDSGSAAVVHAIAPDGAEVAAIELAGVLAFDWEAIAVGPGPVPGVSYVYVGDIGDNFRLRRTISLHRFPEPDLRDPPGRIDDVETIRLSYPEAAEDSEAMWVDPLTGDVYVVTKRQPDGRAVVFTAPAELLNPSVPAPMTPIAEFSFPDNVFVTAADVTADGSVLAFRGYNEVWMWVRRDLEYVATLAAEPCLAPSPEEIQGESLAFSAGLTYVTLSEGSAKPINEVAPLDP
jgi:hypothetical protein